jgi:coenzyme F420 hydrogenase subunit beta
MNNRARKMLPILDNDESLRGDSRFLAPQDWGSNEQLPRALRSLAQIIDNDLCHRCGTCVGICPTNVLGCDGEEYPYIKNLEACTDCNLCVNVCPGDEFNYPKMLADLNRREEVDYQLDPHDTHGYFSQGVLAHATDPKLREASTSGGLVTALLIGMMQDGEIDGAVTIVNDTEELWRGKPIVARSESELLSAMKSKYAITPTNSVFSEIIAIPGRYALVGLPCQIHGFRKAAQLNPKLRERVVFTIALFCHAAIEHEAFRVIWSSLPENVQEDGVRFVSRIGKHPGSPFVELSDGSLYPVYFGEKRGYKPSSIEMINLLYRLYTPKRCMTCFDALGEFADISVGDPWMAPPEDDISFEKGWSFGLIRSRKADQLIASLAARGILEVRNTTRSESLTCNRKMSEEKRLRAWYTLSQDKQRRAPLPEYQLCIPKLGWNDMLKARSNRFSHLFCFTSEWNTRVLKFLLTDFGYVLLYLNHLRRGLKVYLRDKIAYVRRKLLGRR